MLSFVLSVVLLAAPYTSASAYPPAYTPSPPPYTPLSPSQPPNYGTPAGQLAASTSRGRPLYRGRRYGYGKSFSRSSSRSNVGYGRSLSPSSSCSSSAQGSSMSRSGSSSSCSSSASYSSSSNSGSSRGSSMSRCSRSRSGSRSVSSSSRGGRGSPYYPSSGQGALPAMSNRTPGAPCNCQTYPPIGSPLGNGAGNNYNPVPNSVPPPLLPSNVGADANNAYFQPTPPNPVPVTPPPVPNTNGNAPDSADSAYFQSPPPSSPPPIPTQPGTLNNGGTLAGGNDNAYPITTTNQPVPLLPNNGVSAANGGRCLNTQYTPSHTPNNANGACSVEGQMQCAGQGFLTCANGKWVNRACATGTYCRPFQNSILCDFAANRNAPPCSTTQEGQNRCSATTSGFETCAQGVWVARACNPGTKCHMAGTVPQCV